MKLLSLIFSLVAIAISVMCLPSFGFVAHEGNIIAIIGVCTTLVVGLNIYDAIMVREIDKKSERLQQKINDLEKLEYRSEINFKISCALSTLYDQPFTSFKFMLKALTIAMTNEEAESIEKCFSLLSQYDKINWQHSIAKYNNECVFQQILTEMENCRLYNIYQKRINEPLKSVGHKN